MKGTWVRVGVAVVVVVGVVGAGSRAEAAKLPTRMLLDVAEHSIDWSEPVRVKAQISFEGTRRPTGSVAIVLDGTTTVATIPLRACAVPLGSATTLLRSLPAGEHELTAMYPGDKHHAPVTSPERSIQVHPGSTATTLRSTRPTVASGRAARFTARVAPMAPATAVPTGTVTFKTPTVLKTVPLVDGVATWSPRLPDGVHDVVAIFDEGEQWRESRSETVSQRIGPPVSAIDRDVTTAAPVQQTVSTTTHPTTLYQPYTAGVTGTLDKVVLDYDCFSFSTPTFPPTDPNPSFVVEIRTLVQGAPTGPIVGSASIDDAWGGLGTLRDIPLTQPAGQTAGTRYALAVRPTGTTHQCRFALAEGGEAFLVSAPFGWLDGGGSLRFQTWVTPGT